MSLNHLIQGSNAEKINVETRNLQVDGNLTVSGTINGEPYPPTSATVNTYPTNLISYDTNGTNYAHTVTVSDAVLIPGNGFSYVMYNFHIITNPGQSATQQQLWIDTSYYPLLDNPDSTCVGHTSITNQTNTVQIFNASSFNLNTGAQRIEVVLPPATIDEALYTISVSLSWRTTYVPP